MEMFVKVLWVVFLLQSVVSQDEQNSEDNPENQLVIGGIFYEDEAQDLKNAFAIAAEEFGFVANVREVTRKGQTLEISKNVCELAQEKVIGIIDGTSDPDSEHIQALCDAMELPHVLLQPIDIFTKNWSALNMYPSPDVFNMVLTELITLKEWTNFTIIYVKGHSVNRVSRLMEMGNTTNIFTVSVREISGKDFRQVLIKAKKSGYVNFVVDCPSKDLEEFLYEAQQVGLMADEHSYVFVSPDLFTLDLDRFRYGGVNMTGLRMVALRNEEAAKAEAIWEFTAKYSSNNDTGTAENIGAETIKTKLVLVYDAVKVFYEAVKKTKLDVDKVKEQNCDEIEPWEYGTTLLNFMKTNKIEGLTRTLAFDGVGQRIDVTFDLVELTPAGNQSIGSWKENTLTIDRQQIPPAELAQESIMRNKTFKVLIADTPPYAYTVESPKQLEGNDRYEGFTVDLIEKLSEILGFNYEFEIENNYGRFENGHWSGMVLKLMEEKADFALCDLTITSTRQNAIDFSTPFITTGIGILFKEPSKQPPAMFSFMEVFSNEVWYYMVFVQMGVGVVMIFVGRISQKEWQNPVPCVESPEELTNQFSFANSLWLIIGSVMQQGSEIAPIALAPRMITSIWWFFTMIMVASYVGNLVAVLTVLKNVYPFENVEQLYKLNSIKYGAKSSGSTIDFFSNSTNEMYLDMYRKMTTNKWLVGGNDEGVRMAENSSYAFFAESASIEYYTERHCDLLLVGKLLDSKGYGIGMKKGSQYKKYIDNALLQLKESGELQLLKDLWWKEMRGGGKCNDKGDEEIKKLDMQNMLGAFVVLGAGCLIGIVISILDMLWSVFKRSVKYNTTFKYELIEELKFAITFSGDIKPVKKPEKSEKGEEEEALAEAEAKDELGSLRSARTMRSGRSTSTHKSSHSHSSRHSPNSLIVAFARRRKYD